MPFFSGQTFPAGGALFSSDGAMLVTNNTPTTVFRNRFPSDSSGCVFVDYTNSPATTDPRFGGIAFSASTGAMFCTTAAVSASSRNIGGWAVSSTGQLHITFAEPTAKFTNGGITSDGDGVVYVRPEPGFFLPFTDSGAGVVSTTATYGGVSATFTRATTATTVLSTGLIGSVASGSPRSFYDPTSLAYRGYLAEGARTNVLLQSEDFSSASWTKTDTVVTANNTTAPDGAVTADLLTEGSAGTASASQSVTGTANANYAVTRFFKFGNCQWVRMQFGNGANSVNGWFDIQNGVKGSTSVGGTGVAVSSSIKAYPSGWFRCELVGSVNSAATAIASLTLSASGDGAGRVNNATRFEWGAGFEDNVSFASTYIPTTIAAVTRNTDVLTYPTTGWLNAAAGTLLGQFLPSSDLTGNHIIASINDGTNNERYTLFKLNTTGVFDSFVSDGGVTQADFGTRAISATVPAKGAFAYAVNDFASSLNGQAVETDVAGTLPTVTTLEVGVNLATASNAMFGTISSIGYWALRLPNATLQSYTT